MRGGLGYFYTHPISPFTADPMLIRYPLTLSQADVIIGNIQNLSIGGPMLQCVTSIKKIHQNLSNSLIVIVFCPIYAQTVWDASSRHWLQLVWILVFSAILTAVVCEVVSVLLRHSLSGALHVLYKLMCVM